MEAAGGGIAVGAPYHSGKLVAVGGGSGAADTPNVVNEFVLGDDWTVAPDGIPALVTWFATVTLDEHADELFESSISSYPTGDVLPFVCTCAMDNWKLNNWRINTAGIGLLCIQSMRGIYGAIV